KEGEGVDVRRQLVESEVARVLPLGGFDVQDAESTEVAGDDESRRLGVREVVELVQSLRDCALEVLARRLPHNGAQAGHESVNVPTSAGRGPLGTPLVERRLGCRDAVDL